MINIYSFRSFKKYTTCITLSWFVKIFTFTIVVYVSTKTKTIFFTVAEFGLNAFVSVEVNDNQVSFGGISASENSLAYTERLVCLIGGGEIEEQPVKALVNSGAIVVAADGGANHALRLGLQPVAVIGDMDSISPETRAQFGDVLHHIPEQDSTDF